MGKFSEPLKFLGRKSAGGGQIGTPSENHSSRVVLRGGGWDFKKVENSFLKPPPPPPVLQRFKRGFDPPGGGKPLFKRCKIDPPNFKTTPSDFRPKNLSGSENLP